ncbi:replication initiation protein [Salmonella enterica]|nr:replication initiation protein [Salmonella enterica]
MPKQLAINQVKQSTMVYQHNALITAAYRLTLPGKRVLAMALGIVGNTDVQPDGTARDEFPYIAHITVADYAVLFDKTLPEACRDMLAGINEIGRTAATIYTDTERGNFKLVPFAYEIDAVDSKNERGKYTIQLHPSLLAYIGLLKSNFTAYDLLNVGRLSAFNQVRLYEQFAMNKNHGKKAGVNYGTWITDFDFFKSDVFDLKPSLKDYPRTLKRKFLDGALDAVNEQTDLFVEFETKGKQWIFKIYSGDVANARREAWRKDKAAAALALKEEKRLARLAKQAAKREAEAVE